LIRRAALSTIHFAIASKDCAPMLGTHVVSLLVISAIIVWWLGVSMTIYIAGLKAIPAELTEAASIDGAGSLRSFAISRSPVGACAHSELLLIFISCLKVLTSHG